MPLRRLRCRGAAKVPTEKTAGPREQDRGRLPRGSNRALETAEKVLLGDVCDGVRELMVLEHPPPGKHRRRGPIRSSVEISSNSIPELMLEVTGRITPSFPYCGFNGVIFKAVF